jgi:hypothetical protein
MPFMWHLHAPGLMGVKERKRSSVHVYINCNRKLDLTRTCYLSPGNDEGLRVFTLPGGREDMKPCFSSEFCQRRRCRRRRKPPWASRACEGCVPNPQSPAGRRWSSDSERGADRRGKRRRRPHSLLITCGKAVPGLGRPVGRALEPTEDGERGPKHVVLPLTHSGVPVSALNRRVACRPRRRRRFFASFGAEFPSRKKSRARACQAPSLRAGCTLHRGRGSPCLRLHACVHASVCDVCSHA